MLAGIRVLDFTRVLSGPICAMHLADMGADVIKVEHPNNLDPTRRYGPPFAKDFSTYFLSINRNKKSILLDFKKPEDKEIAMKLVSTSDIVLENFVSGKMDSYGMGYDTLKTVKPNLIYAAVRGFGRDSSMSK
jgi:crotonobetainyl-CoA:carnitine CoA-transferase CaiB-like acyl-CoA transferase